MASAGETIATIDRGARGALHLTLQRTVVGAAFVELQHVGADGQPGRGSTLKISELTAVIAALRAIAVREHAKSRPAVQQSLPPAGPDEQARADMAVF